MFILNYSYYLHPWPKTLYQIIASLKALLSLWLFFFLLTANSALSAGPIDAALVGLSERYRGITSLSAAYTRTTVTPATDAVFRNKASQTASGLLQWKRLTKLRLDQTSPDNEAMMTDGLTVWWHIPNEQLVHIYRNVDLAGELSPLLTFMSGLDDLRAKFSVYAAKGEDRRKDQTGLVLDPKDNRESGGRLIIYCDNDYLLTGFRLGSPTGEKTDFYLSNQSLNPGFDDAHFSFKILKGLKVVEETDVY
ncbi:MAG: outer membrane lipoprotein carrier protein LolA [Deltaproteobacteria bacterium]|jgi:chaperone LolA|nr:outer membrane lipoprotein carrier protein LolA [Deltaproteobacteria bacterium]